MPRSGVAAPTPVERFFEFSVLGLLASGFLALAGSGFLDLPTIILMSAAFLCRALYSAGVWYYNVPQYVVSLLTVGYVAFYAADYIWISRAFIPATVHLIVFVAFVKLLTARTNRDYFYLKLIAFLELLAACILSANLSFFVFLVLFLLLGVATFTSSEIRRSRQLRASALRGPVLRGLHRRLMGGSIAASAAILLLTGALFFVLPRTARAAFQHLFPSRYHTPGFSDTVNLDATGDFRQSNSAVLHVHMDNPSDRNLVLRWRGASLTQFDGRRWYNDHAPEQLLHPDAAGEISLVDNAHRRVPGRHISYAVHLKDIASNVLFFAGRLEFIRIDAPLVLRSPTGNFKFVYREPGTLVYEVFSAPEGPDDAGVEPLSTEERFTDLHLPPIDARIWTLAHRVTAGKAGALAQARALETYLRTNYTYTLDLPRAEAPDPLANFLFNRRKGHCEYFASALAVMLRVVGIPSRVVTGFGPGVYNPVSGWQIVRASDAHSWVEAYLPMRGWTTFDATPPDADAPIASLFTRLNFYFDAADTFWQDWVLNYNLDRQILLASRVGESGERLRVSWLDPVGASVSRWQLPVSKFAEACGVALVCLIVLAIAGRRFGNDIRSWLEARRRVRKLSRGQASASDATVLYVRMLKLLKRRGLEKPAWLTPAEFARVIPDPQLSLLVQDFTGAYNDLRFGSDAAGAARMLNAIEKLSRPPATST